MDRPIAATTLSAFVERNASDLVQRIKTLEAAERDLNSLKATLCVNFGDVHGRGHSGIRIKEEDPLRMLINLVEAYDKLIKE